MSCLPVLIDGQWRPAVRSSSFNACNPQTGESLDESYPVSDWADCDAALEAATVAARQLRSIAPERMADFLEAFAGEIEKRAEALVEMAHLETALPKSPRLADVELPRTTNQLRLAAADVVGAAAGCCHGLGEAIDCSCGSNPFDVLL